MRAAVYYGVPVGMAASSVTSVSVSPALVSFCVQDTSRTWPVLRGRLRIGLSVLAEGQEEACVRLSAREGVDQAVLPLVFHGSRFRRRWST